MKKFEPNYILINQLKDKLKHQEHYKGLLSVATYLITFYFEDYYKKEEYEYFTEYKITILIINLMKWLAIANNPHQFGHKKFNFKKSLKEVEEYLVDIKKGIFSMWKNNILDKKIKKMEQKLSDTTNKVENWKLGMYIDMLKDLAGKYPKYELEKEHSFRRDIGLC